MTADVFKAKYGHEIDGWWYPRVTSILEIVAKDGLLRYYANHRNLAEAESNLRHLANHGILVHSVIEKLIKKEKVIIPPEIKPSVVAFQKWAQNHSIKVLNPKESIEKKVFSCRYAYSGTIDMLLEIDGKFGLVDIKTGTGIWDSYSLQTAAYLYAYNNSAVGPKKAKTRWILRVDQYSQCVLCGAKKRKKDGQVRITGGKKFCYHKFSPEMGFIQFKELAGADKDFKAFLYAKGLWEWKNRRWLSRINNYAGLRKGSKVLSFI